jgi:hypothetical protein
MKADETARVNPDSDGPPKSPISDSGDYNKRRAAVGTALKLHADGHLKTKLISYLIF